MNTREVVSCLSSPNSFSPRDHRLSLNRILMSRTIVTQAAHGTDKTLPRFDFIRARARERRKTQRRNAYVELFSREDVCDCDLNKRPIQFERCLSYRQALFARFTPTNARWYWKRKLPSHRACQQSSSSLWFDHHSRRDVACQADVIKMVRFVVQLINRRLIKLILVRFSFPRGRHASSLLTGDHFIFIDWTWFDGRRRSREKKVSSPHLLWCLFNLSAEESTLGDRHVFSFTLEGQILVFSLAN